MDLNDALDYFLEVRTGDKGADLLAALREAARRRKEGPEATTAILIALHDDYGLTFDEISHASYDDRSDARISRATASRLVAQAAQRGT